MTWKPIAFKMVVAIGVLGVATLIGIVAVRTIKGRMPNRYNAPLALYQSAESMIQSMHKVLHDAEDDGKLYDILEPEVLIYSLTGLQADSPKGERGEYRINLFLSRWHCLIYRVESVSVDGMTCELWIMHFAGQGKWYSRLREHQLYVVACATDQWSERRIIARSKMFLERYDTMPTATITRTDDGIRVQWPDESVTNFEVEELVE